YDTMKILTNLNPYNEYYFIIGADMVEYLPHWHKIDELMSMISFVGVNRPNYQVHTPYPIIEVTVPYIDISSTLIRERIKANMSIKYLTPDAVIEYIKEKRLYES